MLETWVTERPEVTETERATLTGLCANFSLWLEEVEAKHYNPSPNPDPNPNSLLSP